MTSIQSCQVKWTLKNVVCLQRLHHMGLVYFSWHVSSSLPVFMFILLTFVVNISSYVVYSSVFFVFISILKWNYHIYLYYMMYTFWFLKQKQRSFILKTFILCILAEILPMKQQPIRRHLYQYSDSQGTTSTKKSEKNKHFGEHLLTYCLKFTEAWRVKSFYWT